MKIAAVGANKPAQFYAVLRQNGLDVEVFFNGVRQSHVVSADEEKGELERYVEDPRATGGLKLHEYTGVAVIETLRGKVLIEIVRRKQ